MNTTKNSPSGYLVWALLLGLLGLMGVLYGLNEEHQNVAILGAAGLVVGGCLAFVGLIGAGVKASRR